MNPALLKSIDAAAGSVLARLLPSPSRPFYPGSPSSVLFIRPGGIGDAVLLAPAIYALRNSFPASRIMVLAERRNAGIFDLIPAVDQTLRYDLPRELLQALHSRHDLVIDTEQWHRLSAVVARLTGTPCSIGYGTNERARLFHHAIPYSQDDYEADSFIKLLAPLGIYPPHQIDASFLTVPQSAKARAAQLLSAFGEKTLVAIFPGASVAERKWGADRFRAVATRLVSRGMGIVVIGGPEDLAAGNSIVDDLPGLNLAGKTTLAESAAIMERASLVISGDSGVLHLAVGLAKLTVSLFGPGIAKKWAPRGNKHTVLSKDLFCSPCTRFGYTPSCPRKAECLKAIAVEEVVNAALTALHPA